MIIIANFILYHVSNPESHTQNIKNFKREKEKIIFSVRYIYFLSNKHISVHDDRSQTGSVPLNYNLKTVSTKQIKKMPTITKRKWKKKILLQFRWKIIVCRSNVKTFVYFIFVCVREGENETKFQNPRVRCGALTNSSTYKNTKKMAKKDTPKKNGRKEKDPMCI